jgi:hypothetical protein
MLPRLRTMLLAGVVALGGLLGTSAGVAKAQVFINTPGFSLGLGVPGGFYPGFGVYPGYGLAPVYGAYPVVPAYPYVYRPGFYYGPRPYGPYYGSWYGYRRW